MGTDTKTKMKVTLTGQTLAWTNRASGVTLFQFDCRTVAAALRDAVFAYGCKQIIADGAAGATNPVSAMRDRAESLTKGTWGQRAARFPDADVWAAVVAVRGTADSEANREKWIGLTSAQRSAIARQAEIAAWLEANAPDTPDADELLAGF